jgi:uncharacterized protein YfaS (alpha-2-macroglobulin family)
MKKILPLLVAALLCTRLFAATPASVELIPDKGEIEPGSTFEFRFPEPMVSGDALGPANQSPIVFDPPIIGDFSWLSTRSGTFTPKGPIPLGSFFQASLRPNLKNASGQPIRFSFAKKFTTPPFRLTFFNSGVWDDTDVTPTPKVKLAFNLPVTADPAAFQFVDAAGQFVTAKVERFTGDEYFPVPPQAEDWNKRWKLAIDPATASNERMNCLIVEPSKSLSPSKAWKLVVNAGLEDITGNYRVAMPQQIPLGQVTPFALANFQAENFINSGPTLTLSFNQEIGPDITPATAKNYFRFEPEPSGLVWDNDYRQLMVQGKFEVGQEYKIHIAQDVYSDDGRSFSGERTIPFTFQPVLPRLYLPDLILSQIVGGRRQLPIRSVNLSSIHVTAKLITPPDVARALSLFESNKWKYASEEKIPDDNLPGEILFDDTIPVANPVLDQPAITTLDWNRILGSKKAGVVVLSVTGAALADAPKQSPAAQALVQLTDLGILWKKAGDSIQARVFSLETAKPIPGASAKLLDANFSPLASALTNPEGVAQLDFSATPAWLEITHGADTNVIGMAEYAKILRGTGFFYSSWTPKEQKAMDWKSTLFTDRPLYKPGETVHVKGYLRKLSLGGLKIPDSTEASLVLNGSDAFELQRIPVNSDANGSIDCDLKLPLTTTGTFLLNLELEGQVSSSYNFTVADYQPDAFELTLDMAKNFPPSVTDVSANLEAKYFFGGKVNDANVRWALRYAQAGFYPEGFEDFVFLGESNEGSRPLTCRGDGRLLGNAPFVIAPILPPPTLAPFSGTLTAEVIDINQQTVSAKTDFTRDASDFYLGMARPESRVVKLGDSVPLSFVAVAPDGKPLRDPVEVSVTIERWTYNIVRVQGAGGAMTFRRDTIKEPVLTQKAMTILPKRNGEVWSVKNGDPSLVFKPATLGHHQVQITTHDKNGREVVTASSFYVSGEGSVVWDYKNPVQVELVPDKSSYIPGETARILVKTPISGKGILSIERGSSILQTRSIPIEGNAPVLELPITDASVPNLNVSLVILRGADASTRKIPTPEFRFGSTELRVENPSSKLDVALTPAKSSVAPGDAVETSITVRDALGHPVPNADVTFYAVDDGILALSGFTLPNLANALLAPVPLRILTGLSLDFLLPEDLEVSQFTNKGYLIGGGGDASPAKIRRNFPGTACWLPGLRTDASGRVMARFTAPDALTRYRLVAVASSGATAFGSAESAVNIARPLMILPGLGQFANVGDKLIARAVVRNQTGQTGAVQVDMEINGVIQSATLDIPDGESRAADFQLSPQTTGDMEILWKASMKTSSGSFSDAALTHLPVSSPMLSLNETWFTECQAPRTNLLSGINPQIVEGRGQAAITLSNTRLSALGANAESLLHYPYGCAEQTASALVPWIVLPTLHPVLPGFQKSNEEIRSTIDVGIARLFTMQTDSGGLAFWPGSSQPNAFASAWGGIVLSLAQTQGARLPAAAWDKLLNAISANLRGLSPKDDTQRLAERTLSAFALSLAGRPESAYHEQLFNRRTLLSQDSRALLALSILRAGGPHDMAAELLRNDPDAPQNPIPFSNMTRTSAIRLLAWTAFQPDAQEVSRLTAELLASGLKDKFSTTQADAWKLLAFENYFRWVEKPNLSRRELSGALQVGAESRPFQLSVNKPTITETVAIPSTPNTLEVQNPDQSPLYAESRFSVYPPLGDQPRQDRGFKISRSYQKLANDGSLAPAENLQVGDRILVTLRLESSQPAQFVAIDDPLPSILEAVNPEFVSRAVADAGDLATSRFINHREMRADRVLYFCDQLPPGAFTFTYLARVRMAGEATAGAPKAECMYRPERFGLGLKQSLKAKPANE